MPVASLRLTLLSHQHAKAVQRQKAEKEKARQSFDCRAFMYRAWRCPTFACGDRKLASALSSFTSEFGMGSGGSHSLWSPGKPVHCRGPEPAPRKVVVAYVCQ